MKKLLWPVVGAVMVSAAFLIPEPEGSLWPSVLAGSVAALIYLIAFSFVWLKEIESTQKRRAIGWTLGVLAFFSGVSATISYVGSSRQSRLLSVIRTTIERNLAGAKIKEPLLMTFRDYRSVGSAGTSLSNIFLAKYDSIVTKDGSFNPKSLGEESTLYLYLSKAEGDSVVLVGESRYITGMDPDFKNYSGETGRFQVEGTLTSNGISYERAN